MSVPSSPEPQDEQALRTRELELRSREIDLKEKELSRSPWSNPLLLSIVAAAIGLFGTIITARINNENALDVERLRNESNVLLEAIKTSNPVAACNNLTLLAKLRYIEDRHNAIQQACSAAPGTTPNGAPSLPATSTATAMPGNFPAEASGTVIDAASKKPISDAGVLLTADDGLQASRTDDHGVFKSSLLVNRFAVERRVTITAHKDGYNDEKTVLTIAPGSVVTPTVQMHSQK